MVTYQTITYIWGCRQNRRGSLYHQRAILNCLPSFPSEEPARPLAFWGPPYHFMFNTPFAMSTLLIQLWAPPALTGRIIFSCPLRDIRENPQGILEGPWNLKSHSNWYQDVWLLQGNWAFGGPQGDWVRNMAGNPKPLFLDIDNYF